MKARQEQEQDSPVQSVTSGQKLKKVLHNLKRTQQIFTMNPAKQDSNLKNFVYHTGKGLRPNVALCNDKQP